MARLDVELKPAPGQDLPPGLTAVTVDVSVGGVRCACNQPLEPYTILQMNLTLVGGDLRRPTTIVAEMRVRRCSERPEAPETRRYEVSMEFVRMTSEDKRRLQSYLNSL